MTAGYASAQKREGKVPIAIKVYQGIGSIPGSLKNFAFASFLLLYYDRVLGMPAAWASGALFIALLIDAISDPMVGSWSDNFRSRLGRRHSFMFASVIPLGLSIFALFSPPQGLSDIGLFGWLLTFTIATRVSMTFFEVPWSALFGEFSADYTERSVIVSYRVLIGVIGNVSFVFLIYTFIFSSSAEFPVGQLNPDSYPLFAIVLGLCMAMAALATTVLTRNQVPFLLQPQQTKPFTIRGNVAEVRLALGNREFRVLFLSVLFSFVLGGTNAAFEIYMRTYFWGLASEGLRWFALGTLGALLVLGLVPWLQNRFDKKRILVGSLFLLVFDGVTLVSLRFLDILPHNGEPLLLWLLVGNAIVRAGLGALILIMFTSMLADLLDAQELKTGRRQEGVFMSAISFSAKATSGVGLLIAGLLLENVIGFPEGGAAAAGALVSETSVIRLGVIDSIILPLFYIFPFVFLARGYRLTRESHEEVQRQLKLVR